MDLWCVSLEGEMMMKRQPANGGSGNGPSTGAARGVPESAVSGVGIAVEDDALSVLEALAGSIEGPVDWSSEHDHYL